MSSRSVLQVGGALLALAVVLLVATLAMPVPLWRTGDQQLAAMRYRPVPLPEAPSRRLWVDTDAACGAGPRVDPDDCLALALLARATPNGLAGISTVFGNAPRAIVDAVTDALLRELASEDVRVPPWFAGLAAPLSAEAARAPATQARDALIAALEAGPLAILALGPLTNIADALATRPDLASRVTRLIAVMGRRPGHVFHPAEGARAGSLLGHGPVFRDFNVAQDVPAVARIVRMRVPITLVPYDAARGIEFTASDVQRLAASGGSGPWLAGRVGAWLAHWQRDIGREGFYPFDLLAAIYVLQPQRFGCADATAWVGTDARLLPPLRQADALLVAPRDAAAPAPSRDAAPALYCAMPANDIARQWRAVLGRAAPR